MIIESIGLGLVAYYMIDSAFKDYNTLALNKMVIARLAEQDQLINQMNAKLNEAVNRINTLQAQLERQRRGSVAILKCLEILNERDNINGGVLTESLKKLQSNITNIWIYVGQLGNHCKFTYKNSAPSIKTTNKITNSSGVLGGSNSGVSRLLNSPEIHNQADVNKTLQVL